ncbi:MAG: hypothetical protein J4F98_16625, partial [Acidobacteria bacterium]|nr:hypothetical protein [Acidobacteriota bacterium]
NGLPCRRAERRNGDIGGDRPFGVEDTQLLGAAAFGNKRGDKHRGQGQERRLDQSPGPLR